MASRRFEAFDEGSRVRALGKRLRDLRPALKQIGAYLVSQAQSAFRLQGRSEGWPLRMTPNIPGIVRDLNQGSDPKPRRFTGGPALTDTGRLRQSITSRISRRSVIVGSALPYAATHQRGGTSRVTITNLGRDTLRDFLARNRGDPTLSPALGWLFNVRDFDVEVRQRKFLEVTADDGEVINEILTGYVTGED